METEPTVDQMEELADEITKSDFPFAKVKKIIKLDPSISLVSPEAVKMLSKAAEMYMLELGKACYTQAVIERRKTVQKKDVDYVIKHNVLFEQLDDLLDDWAEIPTKFRAKSIAVEQDSQDTTAESPEAEELPEIENNEEEELEENIQEISIADEQDSMVQEDM